MTDRDGRNEDSKTCQATVLSRDISLGRNPLSSNSNEDHVLLGQNNPLTITNSDSDGDYETSSEGPQSPRPDFQKSQSSFHRNVAPVSNESILVKSTLLAEGIRNHASYTILGVSDSARKEETEILDHVDQTSSGNSNPEIEVPSWGVEELEARRTEYYVASRIETEATKSESLPVIRIPTPWGSYEYPDIHMPAERLVSDSPFDIKEKMRLIHECMDGSGRQPSSRANFFDYGNESSRFMQRNIPSEDEVKSHDSEMEEAANSRVYSRPTTPRTPKMISVTSPKIFSEPFNVLPIIRNPDVASDYTVPPSPSGSSVPQSSSFYYHLQESDSPRNSASKKPSFDPLSRIEGELGPLQNELSEIRGKVRALNLDYNLSCINGISKNWMAGNQSRNHLQIRPVRDDFVLGDYLGHHNQSKAFGLPNFRDPDQPSYTYEFLTRSSDPPVFCGLEEAGNSFASVGSKSFGRPDDFEAQIFSPENNEPEVAATTDRNLSPVYVCTSTPLSLNTEIDVEAEETEVETESPEVRLPEFFDKIRIVPIAYLHGVPDPPAEPVFNFARPEEDAIFDTGCKVLRIEHPDAPLRRRDFELDKTVTKNCISSSETIFTLDNSESEASISKKDQDDYSVENSARPSDRMEILKLGNKNSGSQFSVYTSQESSGKPYIRGLISGPEDFL